VSDYLSDEEQVARLQSWWRTNGVITIVAIIVAIAAVVGWRWYQNQQATAMAAASDRYTAYVEAEDGARQAQLTRLLGEHPKSTYAQFALMDQAKRASVAGKFDESVKHYQDVLGNKPDEAVADLANVRLARVLQQQDKSDAALTALGAVRGSGFRAQVAELKGDILLQQGDRVGAHEAYAAALAASVDGADKPVLKMKENATSTQVAVTSASGDVGTRSDADAGQDADEPTAPDE
jgi:predicted negative regulator of RcsB-dependent stress response